VAIDFYRDALRNKSTIHIEMSPLEEVPPNLGGRS
jgi:hypothetical protein